MTKEAAFITGFVKAAMSYGLTEAQSHTLLKKADMSEIMQSLQGAAGQAGDWMKANPTATGAIGGGALGAAGGAMAGGKGNRGMGALGGGLAGAGLGAGAGLSMDPAMQQQLMQLLGMGQEDSGGYEELFGNPEYRPGTQGKTMSQSPGLGGYQGGQQSQGGSSGLKDLSSLGGQGGSQTLNRAPGLGGIGR